jgi:hypothetical protein
MHIVIIRVVWCRWMRACDTPAQLVDVVLSGAVRAHVYVLMWAWMFAKQVHMLHDAYQSMQAFDIYAQNQPQSPCAGTWDLGILRSQVLGQHPGCSWVVCMRLLRGTPAAQGVCTAQPRPRTQACPPTRWPAMATAAFIRAASQRALPRLGGAMHQARWSRGSLQVLAAEHTEEGSCAVALGQEGLCPAASPSVSASTHSPPPLCHALYHLPRSGCVPQSGGLRL